MKSPRKVVGAMTATGANVAGIELRPVTASTLVILDRIDSPMMRSSTPGVPVALSDMDVLRVLYVLTHPAAECFRLIDEQIFDRAAIEHGDTVPLQSLPAFGAAINRLWEQALSTVIGPEKKRVTPPATSPSPSLAPATPTVGC